MIVWFTGQPNSGKTTLAKALSEDILTSTDLCACCSKNLLKIQELHFVKHIDGDDLRKQDNNTDYTILGRRNNVERAYKLAKEYESNGDFVIVSLVSPFKDQRELYKIESNIKEIYLISSRVREGKMVDYYEPPNDNCITINTDYLKVEQCLGIIKDFINK